MNEEQDKQTLYALDKRMTVVETLLTGAGESKGLVGVAEELKKGQADLLKFQYLLLGALILLNIVGPIVIDMIRG